MIDIYEHMRARKIVVSKRAFSQQFCNRAPNYLALGNGLSESALIAVFRNLISRGQWILALRVARMILFDQVKR